MQSGITLTLTSRTDTTVTITATTGGFYTIDTYSIEVFDTNSSAGTPVATQAFTIAADQSVPVVVSGLSAGTTYYAFLHGASQGYDSTSVEFTTLDNTPKVATVSQWQDLVTRIKAKADQASVNGDTETYSIAAASWSAVTGADPFTYAATVTAAHTITANTIVELYNHDAVTFATYGFAIASISGQAVTIYALDAPTAAVSLKINYKEAS